MSLLLPVLTTLGVGRLPVPVLQLLRRLSRDSRAAAGGPTSVNSSDTAADTPVGAREKKAAIPPKPLPVWIKRGESNVNASLGRPPVWAKRSEENVQDKRSDISSDNLKRSLEIGSLAPRPSSVWTKRFPYTTQLSTAAKRAPTSATAADDDDDDEFGLPLTPDDFSAAVRLEADALLVAPDASDPTEMAGLYEGDIANVADRALDVAADDPGAAGGRTRNAVRGRHRLWPAGEIPYAISSSFGGQERAVIAAAAQQLSQRSCLRLVPRAGQADYVHIKKGRGCSSDVGRFGGRQDLSLGTGCVYRGVVAHELLHAAGFWHEQSRADRDSHVKIHRDNIRAGMSYNFDKKPWSQTRDLGEPYDVGSVLHYGPKAFAADPSRPTITPLVPSPRMGQRDGPSDLDIAKLNRLYGCDELPTAAPETTPAVCEDTNESCQYWAENGECDKNPNWMGINCALSCGTCGGELTGGGRELSGSGIFSLLLLRFYRSQSASQLCHYKVY